MASLLSPPFHVQRANENLPVVFQKGQAVGVNEKFKGTPGPWRVGPINYADIYGNCQDCLVALVIKDRPETVADARLIASAPRLVEALEMVKFYRESRMGASSSRLSQQYRAEMNDKIEAALAAAYGEKE